MKGRDHPSLGTSGCCKRCRLPNRPTAQCSSKRAKGPKGQQRQGVDKGSRLREVANPAMMAMKGREEAGSFLVER